MTRNGIEYDLTKSPYIFKAEAYTYYFSSKRHRDNFAEKYLDHRLEFSTKLSNKCNFVVLCVALADICLYSKIETRGSYILRNGVVVCELRI